MARHGRIRDIILSNPAWNARQVADFALVDENHVQTIARRDGLRLPPTPRKRKHNRTRESIAYA